MKVITLREVMSKWKEKMLNKLLKLKAEEKDLAQRAVWQVSFQYEGKKQKKKRKKKKIFSI